MKCGKRFLRTGTVIILGLVALPAPGWTQNKQPGTPTANSRIDSIRGRGALRVAVLEEYPWLIRRQRGSEDFAGPSWRLVQDYASRLGVRIETTPVSMEQRLEVVSNGDVDISIAPMLVTPDRERIADFIECSQSAQCFFGLANNSKLANATRVGKLNHPDMTIAYISSSQGEWLRKRLPAARALGVAGSLADGPRDAVVNGEADLGMIDKFFFRRLGKRTPGLVSIPKEDDCLQSQEMQIPVGMAIQKGQLVFLTWLQKVAGEDRALIETEQDEILKQEDEPD